MIRIHSGRGKIFFKISFYNSYIQKIYYIRMRTHFTILTAFLLVFTLASQAQSWQSNCTGNTYLEERYKADVFKLSLDRLIETENKWKDSIDFPQIYKDTIAKAFYAFANMEYTPYKDTILSAFGGISPGAPMYDEPSYLGFTIPSQDSSSIFNMHQSVRYFSVSVKNDAAWAAAWAAGNYANTPNAAVNKLVKDNILSVSTCTEEFCISSTQQKFYTLKTNRPLNTNALVAAFAALKNAAGDPDVADVRPQPYFGGGNEMAVEFTNTGVVLSFINNCENCDAGCDVSVAWAFRARVFTNCQIDLVYITPHFPIAPNGNPANGSIVNGKYYIYPCISVTTLPVTLSNLTAVAKNNTAIQLGFTALTQADAYAYEVEHSTNGNSFTKISSITPILGSPSQAYSYTHSNPANGNNYYRIKVVEKDGHHFYSNIATGFIGSKPVTFSIAPNPAKNSFRLTVAEASVLNRAVLVINSASGRQLLQQPLQTVTSQNINISSLPTGIYWLAIHTASGTQVQKLVVK